MDKPSSAIVSALSTWRVRLGYACWFAGRVVHWTYVPMTIYLGLSLGQQDPSMPELSIRSLLW